MISFQQRYRPDQTQFQCYFNVKANLDTVSRGPFLILSLIARLSLEFGNESYHFLFFLYNSVMEVMKQLDQGEIAATARARLHGDMMPPRNDVQVSQPQAPRPMAPAMNPAFTYPGKRYRCWSMTLIIAYKNWS